jgi:hypothetical protein
VAGVGGFARLAARTYEQVENAGFEDCRLFYVYGM